MPRLLRLLLLLLAAAPGAAFAAGLSMSTLQNLPAAAVVVRGLSPDGVTLGLDEAQLRETVVAVLQEAGVKVVSEAEAEALPGGPTVEIVANVSKISARGFLFIAELKLREKTALTRKTASLVTLPAVTWETQTAGYTGRPEQVVQALTSLADRFGAEWRENNRGPAR